MQACSYIQDIKFHSNYECKLDVTYSENICLLFLLIADTLLHPYYAEKLETIWKYNFFNPATKLTKDFGKTKK